MKSQHLHCLVCLFLLVITLAFVPENAHAAKTSAAGKPNILWIVQEDTSPWIGCYGYKANIGNTPVVDRLASEGVQFNRAYVPAPVCSSCRSGFIVGAYQFRFGGHEHRSRRGAAAVPLPKGMTTIPELMRDAGYHTFNKGKTDYNFTEKNIYSVASGNKKQKKKPAGNPWQSTPKGKPFFGQIQLKGGKTNTSKWPKNKSADPSKAVVPADYPQNKMYREIVAQHCDAIRSDDVVIGKILAALKTDGLLDSTIVVYFSDHGANNLIRHKQMPTEAGLHVPLIIKGPAKWVPVASKVRDDLVSILDVTATTLTWAGVPYPKWIEGQNLFADNFKPRSFVGSGRDRCDHTIDRVRTIRTDRFRYTRNYKLDRVFLQPQYRDNRNYLIHFRTEYAKGTLPAKLAEIYFGERPKEELYDIKNDPAQVNNLANAKGYQDELASHRKILDDWVALGDLGAEEEPDIELKQNGNGRFKGVNAEYERVRTDSDGDGLSDMWEKYNNRDANDGKLLFEFNCGGWQTEGWQSAGQLTNIAGSQGYLDFTMPADKAAIKRKGLKLNTSKNQGSFVVRIKCNGDLGLAFTANGKEVGRANVKAGEDFMMASIKLTNAWQGEVKDIAISFQAAKGTKVVLDWIRVQ